MHRVEFRTQVKQSVGLRLRGVYRPQVAYLLPDKLAGAMAGLVEGMETRRIPNPRPWDRRDSTTRRMLIANVGGLGDYIALLPSLLTLQEQHPNATIDIVTEAIGHQLMRCGGFEGRLIDYPLRLDMAKSYDAFLFIEDATDHPRFREWDLIDVFADYVGIRPPLSRPRFAAGGHARSQMSLPATPRRRVGVQLHGSSALRSYPLDRLSALLGQLVRRGIEVHLFGAHGDCNAPTAPPLFHNWCGRTDDIECLIALVEQMDVLLGPDSCLVHLGGAMGIPTVGMFTVVPARLRTHHYTSVRTLEPTIGCNPCFGGGTCPEGHDHCLMWDQPMLSPQELADEVSRCLAESIHSTRRRAPSDGAYPHTPNEPRTSVRAVPADPETRGNASRTPEPNPRQADIGIGSITNAR